MLSKYIIVLKNSILFLVTISLVFCGLYACASIGTPGGGDYDVDPPRYVSSTPSPDALNFSGNRIEIVFDEIVKLDKPSEKVIVTPPQRVNPVVRAFGNKVRVELKDSLQPNTTYTIDFTNSIQDNNEGNPLDGFTFAFSTGEVVDSLIIAGRLLNAENLEPMPGIMVGLHRDLADSAFTTLPFLRTTKTNELGFFWIRNVAPGTYRVFALDDANRDYKFDQPGEAIAFYDSLVVPSFFPDIHRDTIFQDTITWEIDTILEFPYTHFIPDDLILFLFNEKFGRQSMLRPERPQENKFILKFNVPVESLPEIRLLNSSVSPDWFIAETTDGGRNVEYWLTDSVIYKLDTLKVEVNYLKTDSTNKLSPAIDTVSLFMRGARREAKPKKNEEPKIEFLGISMSGGASMDVFDTLKITFSEPLWELDPNAILFEQKVDTLWEKREFPVYQDSANPRTYIVDKKWSYEQEYQVTIDSATIYSIYGKWNNFFQSRVKFKTEEDYGHLYVAIEGNETTGIGELLDGSDRVVRRTILKNGELSFPNLKPGKYFLRYIEDVNGNGIWDTGSYEEKRQPEKVFYFPGAFEVRQNWDVEQSWYIHALPVYKQKPLEITKNKPAEKKVRQQRR